ncbi:39S ribosomal protein L52, mitochondrial [Habropoda laboriosa]|uniref:Large ribosomal subunit protein mL52 n=1 Tax=Habropoda laboriosa TaxID=597456 RepID=A0A0L7RHC9_9HYME|nr:39S ribosomal protein L52, mitochondrial [Habropoda laboriosa]
MKNLLYNDYRKGLVKNPHHVGPIITSPDYSFKDSRPIPYGVGQLRRIQKHQKYVKQVVQLVGEIDRAVERHAMLMKEKEDEKQKILDSKLKPKGQKLITST